jgi:hypothetical protein
MQDLVLDSNIRLWVFLPIVLITFLIGLVRHYVSLLLASEKKADLEAIKDAQVLLRSRLLRENGRFIPQQSFLVRKQYFNDAETGFFKTTNRSTNMPNPMTDPSMMKDAMKGNMMNVLPMIVIGGWINWTFSGFITTKVPFPLTLRFKPMLQRGIELVSLDASWVSSASWYFLNVFGLRSVYALVLGADNSADQTAGLQDQFSTGGVQQGQDVNKLFKAEWEALEICSPTFALDNIEDELMKGWQISDKYLPNAAPPSNVH